MFHQSLICSFEFFRMFSDFKPFTLNHSHHHTELIEVPRTDAVNKDGMNLPRAKVPDQFVAVVDTSELILFDQTFSSPLVVLRG